MPGSSLGSMTPIETRKGAFKAALLFALLGPLIGASTWALPFFVSEYGGGSMVWPFVLVIGFLFGVIPACVAGIGFVFVVRARIRKENFVPSRSLLALYGATLGLIATLLLGAIFGVSAALVLFLLQGTLSGAICGALCVPLIVPRASAAP
jgi:hypothetical protein